MRTTKARIGAMLFALYACLAITSCSCDKWIKLFVFTGHRSPEECRRLADSRGTNDLTIICPGEEVTVCWHSNVDKVSVSPKLGVQGPDGIGFLTLDQDTTVEASPADGSCAGKQQVNVKVIRGPTPSTWNGSWDPNCSKISFEIHEEFVSKKVRALDITATWSPTVGDPATGNSVACSTPPFLDGFNKEEVFGFKIANPNQTVSFSRPLRAVANWEFKWTAQCPGSDLRCNPNANLPFDLTLICP
ncbi:MAG: hypothetical protein IRY99_14395 [Isosphaeraceae bacterium]|nr:hypothetical protein [Isosphaeraceae bacterium]